MRKYFFLLTGAFYMTAALSCSGSKNQGNDTAVSTEVVEVNVPAFNADSAYQYVKQQVDFGPRVPNSAAHVACGDYLASELERHGAVVTSQYADLQAYTGTILKARNIIGSFQPENKKRVLLLAHWDSRPWADADPDPSKHRTPILGANDGASGVGVLLEMARLFGQQQPNIGVDIMFVDAEDYGSHAQDDTYAGEESWCLGTQYWARNPHVPGYNARYGILLDMVGGQQPTFYREYTSERYAKGVNQKVWNMAKKLGYGNYFIDQRGGAALDDHVFVNQIANIPTIDIIPHDPTGRYSFDPNWHTLKDDMSNINPATLGAVGAVVTHVIYNEK